MNKKNTFKAIKDRLSLINQRRGVVYPEIGYMVFADYAGTGIYTPRVYTIISEFGGVSLSEFNGATYGETLERLRDEIRSGSGVIYQANSEFFASIVRPEFTIQIFRNDIGRYSAILAGSRESRNHWCDCPEIAAEAFAREKGLELQKRLYRLGVAYWTPSGRRVELTRYRATYSPDLARIMGAKEAQSSLRHDKRRKVGEREIECFSVTYSGEQIGRK